MGWQDAPAVEKKRPDWMLAPAIEQEKSKAEDPGFLTTAAIGAGNWLDSKAAGLKEAVRGIGGDSVVNVIDSLGSSLGMADGANIEQQHKSNAPTIDKLRELRPGAMLTGEFAGDLAGKTPLGMALLGGLDQGSLGERATRAGIGFAGGKAGELLGKGIAKVAGPRAMAVGEDAANKWDIPLTRGQASQSKPAQIVESVVSNLPGGSGVMAKANDATFGAFNRAVSRQFGEDATQLTPELMGAAKARAGGQIGEIAGRNSMKFDEPLFNDLLRVQERARNELVPEQAAIVTRMTNNIVRDVNPEGEIAGKMYKAYDSQLGKMAKQNQGTLSDVLGDLRSSMRTHMDKNISPADADKWAVARRQYMNLQTVADAAKNTGDGSLSPARLLQAVNASQKNAKFGAGNDLAELAQWAKKTLPDKIPNSGTAQRLFYQKLLSNPVGALGAAGGIGYGADQLGLGAEAAGGIPLAYVVARSMAGKPSSKATEELLKKLGGGLLGAGSLTYAR
jgi:hypothetical protein